MAKGLFDKFCSEIGVKPDDVAEELTPRVEIFDVDEDLYGEDEDDGSADEENEWRVVGAIKGSNQAGAKAVFHLRERRRQDDDDDDEERLAYRGNKDQVLECILKDFEKDILSFAESDCHGVVREDNSIYILEVPYYSGKSKPRMRKLVAKYKHVMLNRGVFDRDILAAMGYKAGRGCVGPVAHEVQFNELVCTVNQLRKIVNDIGDVLAKGLSLREGHVKWFDGFQAKKVDYAGFIVKAMEASKKLGCDVTEVRKELAKQPYDRLLKDEDQRLKDLGKLIVSCRRSK